MDPRKQREIEHDRKILHDAEKVWGRSGMVGRKRVERRADLIVKSCTIRRNKTILEIGAGTGTLTRHLAVTGAKIVATDLFEDFLMISKRKINQANVEFVVADAEKLDNFTDNSFDVICGLSILHHLNIELALQNIYRVLKPGGAIAFSEPNMLNPQIMIQKNIPFIKRWLGDSPDETAFFRWQMEELLHKSGFSEIIVTPFDFLHPSTPQALAGFIEGSGKFLERIPLLREIAGSLFIFAKK